MNGNRVPPSEAVREEDPPVSSKQDPPQVARKAFPKFMRTRLYLCNRTNQLVIDAGIFAFSFVPDGVMVVGVPARILKPIQELGSVRKAVPVKP